jgi:hypothetical protein
MAWLVYQIVGLVLSIRLVMQTDVRPAVAAAVYATGYAFFPPLSGYHWLMGLSAGVVAFGLTYVYLVALDRIGGWKYWVVFLLGGYLIMQAADLVSTQVCWVFGVKEWSL